MGTPRESAQLGEVLRPQLGRFTSEAPIGLAGDFNQYAYASGNPISRVDPLGLWSIGLELYGDLGGGVRCTCSDRKVEIMFTRLQLAV